jgi:lipopolysaccharide export system protein LptC
MTERRNATGAIAEPLGTIPPRRARLDFSVRSRTTVGEAQRYTRFVVLMKRGLLLGAVALLGAVIAYAIQPRGQQKSVMTFEKMGMVAGDLAMIKPKLTGLDSSGNPYVVTADTAIQDPKNMRRATLKNVEADQTLKNGQWMTTTAPHGWLDADAKFMRLTGAIAVFTDQGFEMHTDLANIDLAKGVAIGPHRVWGHGPSGTFLADRFRIEHLGTHCTKAAKTSKPQRSKAAKITNAAPACVPHPDAAQKTKPLIYLVGNVHMTLYPKKDAKKAKKK